MDHTLLVTIVKPICRDFNNLAATACIAGSCVTSIGTSASRTHKQQSYTMFTRLLVSRRSLGNFLCYKPLNHIMTVTNLCFMFQPTRRETLPSSPYWLVLLSEIALGGWRNYPIVVSRRTRHLRSFFVLQTFKSRHDECQPLLHMS
jgi:hypothetical protein